MLEAFRFEGFTPSEELQVFAKNMLWQLDSEAPSDACVQASIVKTHYGFQGLLQIRSLSGTFSAQVTGREPEKVVRYLCDKVRQQIFRWRKDRFRYENNVGEPVVGVS